MAYAEAKHRLPEGMTVAGWLAIRPNLAHVGEAADWWAVVTGPVAVPPLSAEDRAYLGEAARSLAWSDDPWHSLTGALKAATDRKLPLIGETEARARLERAAGI